MNAQAPISTEHQMARHLLGEFLRVHEAAPHVAVATADAFLEASAPTWPGVAPLFGEAQVEADWWAEFATGTMVAAMLSACLKRLIKGQMIMAPNARKRAMVAIWNSLPPSDRAAFLDYAQPGSAAKA